MLTFETNVAGKFTPSCRTLSYETWELRYYTSERTYVRWPFMDGDSVEVYWNEQDTIVGLLHEYGHVISNSEDEWTAWVTAVRTFGNSVFWKHMDVVHECLESNGLSHRWYELLSTQWR